MVIADFQVLYFDPYIYPSICNMYIVHAYVFRRTVVKEGCSRECVKNAVCNEETKLPPSI